MIGRLVYRRVFNRRLGRTRRAMDHALGMDADVRLLERAHPLSAPVAKREERKRVARELLEDRIVVSP